jgi:hypothetical protein
MPFLGEEVDQDHRCRADLPSAGLKGTAHRHVDRVDDKAANSEFRIEVHVLPPLEVELSNPIILYRPIISRP